MAKRVEKTKQDYLNLLQETINFYTVEKNERAVNEVGGCHYYKDGKSCAVGRCLINPKDKDDKLKLSHLWNTTVHELLELFSQGIFKKEYRGFDTDFWWLLQQLHDSVDVIYWNNFRLTANGKDKVKEIEEWIEANVK